jgi:predicted ester cyclase
MPQRTEVIERFYEHFNERRIADAAALFSDDALVEHAPLRRQERGGAGFLVFARMWLTAFPDARLQVERIAVSGNDTIEVELSADGTHLGALEMGSCGVFKPSGVHATLRLRQMFEIRDRKIVFSSLSFDLLDIVRQLVTVDVPRLLDHLRRIQQLSERLAGTCEGDPERLTLTDRIGTELDAARRVVRPYFGHPVQQSR